MRNCSILRQQKRMLADRIQVVKGNKLHLEEYHESVRHGVFCSSCSIHQ